MLRMQAMGADKPESGDLIEISRGAFQHWAVYVDDGYVVHLVAGMSCSGASSSTSGWFGKGKVKKEKLQDVVNEDKWKINNILDETHKPKSHQEIVKTALSCEGKNKWYSLYFWNCEHFATWCRYGISRSRQVLKATGTTAVAAGLAVGGGIVAGPIGALGVVAAVGSGILIWKTVGEAISASS